MTPRVENAMKTVLGVLAALVTIGIAVLSVFTAQELSSPPDHVARSRIP
jgi:hypothetical protein